jgi:predicted RNase H-like nuclease (RuvC/YqgF family)
MRKSHPLLIAGVDPGISGALALVDHEGRVVEVADRLPARRLAAALP